MKNLLKRSGESVTDLKSDLFTRTQRQLIILNSVAMLLILSLSVLRFVQYERILTTKQRVFDDFTHAQTATISQQEHLILKGLDRAARLNMLVNVSFTLLSLLFIYFSIKLTLKPLKESLERQKRFIQDVSHELLTPLTNLRTIAETALLQQPGGIEEEMTQALHRTIAETDRMAAIIKNFLKFNDAINEKFSTTPIDITASIAKVVTSFKDQAQQKNIHVSFNYSVSVIIPGDAVALEQVLLNILKNALDHTPTGGTVTISIDTSLANYITVTIADTGHGIAPQHLPHIFEPFYKADPARKYVYGSFGLGLTLAQYIVKKHKGNIFAASEVGKGTTIKIQLQKI